DDGMIARREIVLVYAVAIAGLADLAGLIDAQSAEHVARPAAALAFDRERILGFEDRPRPQIVGMELEVALLAEQTEAVFHLPHDLQRWVGRLHGCRLGCCRRRRLRRGDTGKACQRDERNEQRRNRAAEKHGRSSNERMRQKYEAYDLTVNCVT